MKRISTAFFSSITFFIWTGEIVAQDFNIIGGGLFVEISGAIEVGAHVRFRNLLRAQPNVIGVRLNSPGGVVVSALSMAEEIHDRRLSTFIANDDICASACSILFFAGYDRLAKGRLGVHQMNDGGRGNASSLQFVLADQLDAFQQFAVPWTVVRYMLTTPPEEMHWISTDDLANLGLNRDLPGDASDFRDDDGGPYETLTGFSFSDFRPETYLTVGKRYPGSGCAFGHGDGIRLLATPARAGHDHSASAGKLCGNRVHAGPDWCIT